MVAAQGAVSSIFSWMSTLAVLIDYASKHTDLLDVGELSADDKATSLADHQTLIPL